MLNSWYFDMYEWIIYENNFDGEVLESFKSRLMLALVFNINILLYLGVINALSYILQKFIINWKFCLFLNSSAKYADFKKCVEIQTPACEGNIMLSMLNETYAALTIACTEEINPGNSFTQQVLVSLFKFSLIKNKLKFIHLSN